MAINALRAAREAGYETAYSPYEITTKCLRRFVKKREISHSFNGNASHRLGNVDNFTAGGLKRASHAVKNHR